MHRTSLFLLLGTLLLVTQTGCTTTAYRPAVAAHRHCDPTTRAIDAFGDLAESIHDWQETPNDPNAPSSNPEREWVTDDGSPPTD
jgi:hypothetical protein